MKFITFSNIRFNVDHIVAYEKIKDSDINKHKSSYVHVMNVNDRFIVSETVEEIDEMIRQTFKH